MKKAELFDKHVKEAWKAIKSAYHKKYHARLRNTLLKLIAKEDDTYPEFVSLMSVSGWDPTAEIFRKSEEARQYMRDMCDNADEVNKELDAAADNEPDENEDSQVLHRCHYCGDMYHVSELTGAKMGLICYKCRHEMENRD
jgi:hypothetical protein